MNMNIAENITEMTIARTEDTACTLLSKILHAISKPKPSVKKTEIAPSVVIKMNRIKAEINTNLLTCLSIQSIILARSIGH